MSAENVVNTPIVEVAADAVKQKKPTLAGKYSKLLTFGYWFASIIDNEEMKAQMHTQLRLFGTIEEQTELFERFFAEEKDTAKAIRKCIADHNKPPKPVKTKAVKATRKGKADVHQDELISQLLADANAVVDEPVPAKVDKEAAKLAKEQAKEAAKLAKEQEKEAAKLAKEQEKADAIRAKEAEKEAAKLAKEQEKADKEMAKLAKKVELEAKAAAKLAKEQEKASKPEKKKATKTSAIAPVAEVVAEPVVLETVVAEPIVEKVEEVPENTAQVTQELVAEVIEEPAAAPAVSTEEPEPLAVPAASTTEAPKEKSKKTKETKQKPAKETKEPKETKKKAEKKPKETPKPVEEEEEIQTRVANIAGNDYLIDQDFNVYAMEDPHDHIGVYNQETGAIDAL
jgi:hypothetical protein